MRRGDGVAFRMLMSISCFVPIIFWLRQVRLRRSVVFWFRRRYWLVRSPRFVLRERYRLVIGRAATIDKAKCRPSLQGRGGYCQH